MRERSVAVPVFLARESDTDVAAAVPAPAEWKTVVARDPLESGIGDTRRRSDVGFV